MNTGDQDSPIIRWMNRISLLNHFFESSSKQFVDIQDHHWESTLKNSPTSSDEASIRAEAKNLLMELIDYYKVADDKERSEIRKLYSDHTAFAWAVNLPIDPMTEDLFRQCLIRFSILDQGQDPRDAILSIQTLCKRAIAKGINIKPILQEIAKLSSNEDKCGMGSTKDLLLKAADWFPP